METETKFYHSRRQVNEHIQETCSNTGILLLLKFENKPTISWIPTKSLPSDSTKGAAIHLEELCKLSNIKDLNGFCSIPIDSINFFKIEATLTLYKDKAAAITAVHIDSDSGKFPLLWFDPIHNVIDSPSDVLDLLKSWMHDFGWDLHSLDDGTNMFYLSPESTADRWPEGIPKPERDSRIFQLGSMGLGLINTVLGAPAKNKIEDVGFDVLEKFSKVTHYAKDQTTRALEHPLAKPIIPLIPEDVRTQFLSSAEAAALVTDYDSATHFLSNHHNELQTPLSARRLNGQERIIDTTHDFSNIKKRYQAHFTGTPLTIETWQDMHDDNGDLKASVFEAACRIFCGGIEPALRKELWPKILKATSWHSADPESEARVKRESFNIMKASWNQILDEATSSSPDKLVAPQEGAVGDENENADVVTRLKERFYRIDKDVARTDQNVEYFHMQVPLDSNKPLRISIEANPNLETLRNVLLTYTVYNFNLGYVQGMNDLCSPILETLQDETLAFWTFSGFMERMAPNFNRDQVGMRDQLRQLELLLKAVDPPLYAHFQLTDSSNMFCCFRWLLILFKREFYFEDIKTLWEIIWICPLTSNFHLFISVAILNSIRQKLLRCEAFDEVLKLINNQTLHINVPEMIQHAEVFYYLLRDRLRWHGPTELVHLVETQLNTVRVEEMLVKISGIPSISDQGFDQLKFQNESYISEEEWIDLHTVLGTAENFSRAPSPESTVSEG